MRLTNQLPPGTPPSPLLTPNRIKLIKTENLNSYLEHWGGKTKTQNKFDCYRGLNRKYEMAEYLYSILSRARDRERQRETKRDREKERQRERETEREDETISVSPVCGYL